MIRELQLEYIGWKTGDKILTDEEIIEKYAEKRNADDLIRQAAKQVVITKLGITAEQFKLLFG